jgi:hypothetical protein
MGREVPQSRSSLHVGIVSRWRGHVSMLKQVCSSGEGLGIIWATERMAVLPSRRFR